MADDVASLGITVDTQPLQQAAAGLAAVGAAAQQMGTTVKTSTATATAAMTSTSTATASAARSYQSLMASITVLTGAVQAVTSALNNNTAAHQNNNNAAKQNAASQGFLAAAFKGINLQLVALSAGAGPVGTFLSSLGPWGFAAAVGLGALEKIFGQLSEDADMLGEKAVNLKRFAAETNLTFQEIATLKRVMAEFGLSSQEAENRVVRLVTSLQAAREGTGELYERTRQLDPALALEYRDMTNASQGIDIFTRTLAKANDELERAKIARAALGRGGEAAAPGFLTLGAQGGLSSTINQVEDLGTKSSESVEKLAHLNEQIKILQNQINIARATPFALDIKEAEKAKLELELDLVKKAAQAAREAADAAKERGFWYNLIYQAARLLGGEDALLLDTLDKQTAELKQQTEERRKQEESAKAIAAAPANVPLPTARPAGAGVQPTNPVFDANAWKTYIGALGNAATAGERYQARLAEIKKAENEGQFAATGLGNAQEALGRATRNALAEFDANKVKDYVTALGAAATETDRFNQRLAETNQKQIEVGASAEQRAASDARLNQQHAIELEEKRISALGSAATEQDKFRLGVMKLKDALADQSITAETAERGIAALATDQDIGRMRENVSALGDAATESEKYALAVAELKQKLDEGKISQDAFTRAVANANPVFHQLKESSEQFFSSFLNDLAQGNSMSQALSGSLKSVGSSLVNAGVKNIINNPTSPTGYIEAGVGFFAQLFGSKSAAQQQQEQQQQQAAQQAAQAAEQQRLENQIAGFNASQDLAIASLGTINNLNQAMAKEAIEETKARYDAQMRGNVDMTVLEQQFAAQRLQIQKEYQEKALERQRSYEDRLFAATNDTTTLAGQLAAYDRQAAQERAAEVQAGGEALVQLEAAQAAERAKIVSDYNKQQQQIAEEQLKAAQEQADAMRKIFQSIQDYIDQLRFGNLSTLGPEQQLKAAQDQFAQQLDLAKAGNQEALNGITRTADTLLNVAKSFYASSTGYASIYENVTGSLADLVATQPGLNPLFTATGSVAPVAGTATASVGGVTTSATTADVLTTSFVSFANTINADARKNFSDLASTLVDVGKSITDSLADVKATILQTEQMSEANARVIANQTVRPGTSTVYNVSGLVA